MSNNIRSAKVEVDDVVDDGLQDLHSVTLVDLAVYLAHVEGLLLPEERLEDLVAELLEDVPARPRDVDLGLQPQRGDVVRVRLQIGLEELRVLAETLGRTGGTILNCE